MFIFFVISLQNDLEKENINFFVESPEKKRTPEKQFDLWSTFGSPRKKTPLKENESMLFFLTASLFIFSARNAVKLPTHYRIFDILRIPTFIKRLQCLCIGLVQQSKIPY